MTAEHSRVGVAPHASRSALGGRGGRPPHHDRRMRLRAAVPCVRQGFEVSRLPYPLRKSREGQGSSSVRETGREPDDAKPP